MFACYTIYSTLHIPAPLHWASKNQHTWARCRAESDCGISALASPVSPAARRPDASGTVSWPLRPMCRKANLSRGRRSSADPCRTVCRYPRRARRGRAACPGPAWCRIRSDR